MDKLKTIKDIETIKNALEGRASGEDADIVIVDNPLALEKRGGIRRFLWKLERDPSSPVLIRYHIAPVKGMFTPGELETLKNSLIPGLTPDDQTISAISPSEMVFPHLFYNVLTGRLQQVEESFITLIDSMFMEDARQKKGYVAGDPLEGVKTTIRKENPDDLSELKKPGTYDFNSNVVVCIYPSKEIAEDVLAGERAKDVLAEKCSVYNLGDSTEDLNNNSISTWLLEKYLPKKPDAHAERKFFGNLGQKIVAFPDAFLWQLSPDKRYLSWVEKREIRDAKLVSSHQKDPFKWGRYQEEYDLVVEDLQARPGTKFRGRHRERHDICENFIYNPEDPQFTVDILGISYKGNSGEVKWSKRDIKTGEHTERQTEFTLSFKQNKEKHIN